MKKSHVESTKYHISHQLLRDNVHKLAWGQDRQGPDALAQSLRDTLPPIPQMGIGHFACLGIILVKVIQDGFGADEPRLVLLVLVVVIPEPLELILGVAEKN